MCSNEQLGVSTPETKALRKALVTIPPSKAAALPVEPGRMKGVVAVAEAHFLCILASP